MSEGSVYKGLLQREIKIHQKLPGKGWIGYGLLELGSHLWFLMDRKVEVLRKDGTLVRSLSAGINGGRGCARTSDDTVVVATLHAGLQEFGADGSCRSSIAKGKYWDVRSTDGKLFAICEVAEEYLLHVFKKKADGWLKIQEQTLQVPYTSGDRLTLAVIDQYFYICSHSNKTVYALNQDGQCETTSGKPGVENKGELWEPYVCAHDSEVILVGDRDNHRLQIFDPKEDSWSIVKITPENTLKNPYAAVIDKSGILYVIGEPRGKYFLYVCK